jgi:hypothetical protein
MRISISRNAPAAVLCAMAAFATAVPSLASGAAAPGGRSAAGSTAAHIYWTEPETSKGPSGSGINTIWRAGLNGTPVNRNFIPSFEVPGPVAVDASHIYFSNNENGGIGRANLNGTHVNLNFINATGDALALTSSHIYWTEIGASGGSVWQANLDGSHKQRLASLGSGSYFGGLAIAGGQIYWTNRDKGTIGRAALNGTHVNRRLITALANPTGLAVANGNLYWASATSGTGNGSIGRAKVSGTGVQRQFITGVADPFGVAAAAGHLYWADEGAGTIGRARLGGTHVQLSFISAQPMFMGYPGAEPLDIAVGP